MLSQHKHVKRTRHRLHKRKPSQRQLSLKRQRGVVIVVALFIVALVATISYVMMARLDRDTERTSLLLRDVQAEFYAQGSIAWAIAQLHSDWENQKQNQLIDATPIISPVTEVNGYKIMSTIYDMQGRFNLNNLNQGNGETQTDFMRLLRVVEPDLSDQNAQDIARAVLAWVSPMGQQGDESKYYSELSLPYRAAHRPMISISELRLVKGITPQLFNALRPYVTALPNTTLLNVQSAAAPVFVILSKTMTLDAGRSVEELRAKTPIVSTRQFLNLDVVKNHQVAANKIIVTSSYFLVETHVEIEKQRVVLYTLLERITSQKNKATVSILWQSKGIW
jgi:general secretion pathway protein K